MINLQRKPFETSPREFENSRPSLAAADASTQRGDCVLFFFSFFFPLSLPHKIFFLANYQTHLNNLNTNDKGHKQNDTNPKQIKSWRIKSALKIRVRKLTYKQTTKIFLLTEKQKTRMLRQVQTECFILADLLFILNYTLYKYSTKLKKP